MIHFLLPHYVFCCFYPWSNCSYRISVTSCLWYVFGGVGVGGIILTNAQSLFLEGCGDEGTRGEWWRGGGRQWFIAAASQKGWWKWFLLQVILCYGVGAWGGGVFTQVCHLTGPPGTAPSHRLQQGSTTPTTGLLWVGETGKWWDISCQESKWMQP